jgi:hypothetical protein
MKKKTCLDYYKLPLKVLDFDEIYIFTQNGKVAMNYIGICGDAEASKNEQNLLKDIINGDVKGEYTNVTISNNIIYINDNPKLIIRGWGMLTGVGGYKLANKKAAEVQDEFTDYVIKKLKGEL